MIDRIILYTRFWFTARHRRGRGVHPPFAWEFIHEAVFGEDVPGLDGIENLRRSLLRDGSILEIRDHGTGGGRIPETKRSIRSLVKGTAIHAKKGRLLARIARYLDFSLIIELGTGTGISSLYMGMSCPRSRVLTCEGSPATAVLAETNIRRMGAGNIEVGKGVFMDWLPGVLEHPPGEVLFFLDGDHRGERLMQYCSMILKSGLGKAVLVLDDIHWSADMNRAWKTMVKRDEISLSLELFNTGILFYGYKIQRDHFILIF